MSHNVLTNPTSTLENTARQICEKFSGYWKNSKGMCCCPAHDDKVCLMDSTVFVQGVIENNPDAYVQVYFVSEERGMAIRIADNRKRHKREAMAKARQAHFLYLKKMPYKQIASRLGVKTSRISQMISEAKTEIKYERFANLIVERSKIPARFWGSVYATQTSRSKADEENPRKDGESRLDEFNAMIAKIVALGEPITLVEARARLAPQRRRFSVMGSGF